MESKRRLGDRKDGRLIQSLAPFYKFMPYIMPTLNFIRISGGIFIWRANAVSETARTVA